MRTLVHLSDLHFGRVDRDVADQLVEDVNRLAPDVIAVSGDLTQRARTHQFREARSFIERLPQPQLVVPGNHDVPLHNVFARFFNPLGRYRRHITSELRPSYVDTEIMVVGTNTTRSFTVGGGGMRKQEINRICRLVNEADQSLIKVLVGHHPFDVPHAGAAFERATRGRDAVELLAHTGIDLFLTGHLHLTYAGPTATRYRAGGRNAIVVEAGTATSTRMRGEPNAFNVLRVAPATIVVEHRSWQPGSRRFDTSEVQRFERREDGWTGDV